VTPPPRRERGRRPDESPPDRGSRIHQGLVGKRELVGTAYLADPKLRAEYAHEIAPRTVAALRKILRQTFPDGQTGPAPKRLLDLGAGTGAVGTALREHFGARAAVVAVDRVSGVGVDHTADVTRVDALARVTASANRFDLVVAAHVLNELCLDTDGSARTQVLATLVRRWCDALLADGGTLIVLEPALSETSRVLLAVRDTLLDAGLSIVAPCFFAGPCPALLRERDWCHDAAPIDNRKRVDFSYLVIRTRGHRVMDPTLFRIVSDPIPEKGRLKLFACGTSGRHAVVRLDKEATPTNATFGHVVRGDVALISRTTLAQDGLRVVADTTFDILKRAPIDD
jgi:SAM-dependent methyltransferase